MGDLSEQARRLIAESPEHHDMTLRQLAILGMFRDCTEKYRNRVLALTLGLSKPVITRAMRKLIMDGFVIRHADPEDGRDCFFMLTVAGAAFQCTLREIARNG